ncbi:MAG: NADH-quinone oxidoreductase subunit NuoH [Commensalibacter sp.]|nr:NADH-quinone oxidoreductase subunit NuoH [Commensalibacter sp.]
MAHFFLYTTIGSILLIVLKTFAVLVPLLVGIAYLTWMERKVLAAIMLRRGPNVVGPFGLMQPFADAVKMMFKETTIPARANRFLFFLAPVISFTLALAAWVVIPTNNGWAVANLNVGVFYLLALSSLGVYGILLAGWASNSKYPLFGAMRATAQMIAYEVSLGLVIVSVLLLVGSANLNDIVLAQRHIWFCIPLFPIFIIFFISALAETNRPPFDFAVGESELVAGFFSEYSSLAFGLFFLAEYGNMILMSAMTSVLFLGGWLPLFDIAPFNWLPGPFWLILKILFCLFCFIWVRSAFPRYRYDQLMRLGWKVFLPFSLIWVVLTAGFLMATGLLPNGGVS